MTIGRCAAHYENDRPRSKDDSLYSQLLHTKIYESMSITRTVSLCLSGSVIASRDTSGNFHLDECESHFKLYVPSQERDQEICFFTAVPKRLAKLFSIVDAAAEKIISDIWTASSAVIDELLDKNGIVKIHGMCAPVHAELLSSETQLDNFPLDRESGNACSASSIDEGVESSDISDSKEASDEEEPDLDDDTALDEASVQSARSSVRSPIRADISVASAGAHITATELSVSPLTREVPGYEALLEHVICAGELIELPAKSHQALSPKQGSVFGTGHVAAEQVFGKRDLNPFAHDSKVGAAGELLVSREMFSKGRANLLLLGI